MIAPIVAEYFELNGTSYIVGTTMACAEAIEKIRASRVRVRIIYGDPSTLKAWEGHEFGTIGRSCGTVKVPLLAHNVRSLGGGAIATRVVLEIRESKGGRVLYRRKAGES